MMHSWENASGAFLKGLVGEYEFEIDKQIYGLGGGFRFRFDMGFTLNFG